MLAKENSRTTKRHCNFCFKLQGGKLPISTTKGSHIFVSSAETATHRAIKVFEEKQYVLTSIPI